MTHIIEIQHLSNILNGITIHKNLNLTVKKGSILGLIGGSGAGKTTLLRNLLMLLKPSCGQIKLFDQDIIHCDEQTMLQLRRRFSAMFQQGALFSGLTVLENILFPISQLGQFDARFATELGLLKLNMVGLEKAAAHKFPAELSGGMLKRAAAARALALDPELLFLDEPTAGLDPKSAADFDKLLLQLRDMLGLTIFMISHDIQSLERVTDSVAFLGEGQVLALEPLNQLKTNSHPLIKNYFTGE